VLALLSTTSILTSRTVFARQAFNRANGQANNNFANNGGNFPGNNGNGNFQGNPGRNGGNFQGRGGGFNTFTIFRNLGVNPQIIGYVTLGISILGIVLVLLSAFGVWQQKSWGLNLGMVMAILFLIGAVPAIFSLGGRNINWLRTSINILTLLAAIPILVFGILPSVRDTVTAK
jgi:hypothetical protein